VAHAYKQTDVATARRLLQDLHAGGRTGVAVTESSRPRKAVEAVNGFCTAQSVDVAVRDLAEGESAFVKSSSILQMPAKHSHTSR
jgi:hypothetical protein